MQYYPRCHLAFTADPCTHQDTDISPATDVCQHVAEYSVSPHFTAPSAAHLTICFSPDSQHPRLSVKASLPLSPHQRFIYEVFCSIAPFQPLVNIKRYVLPFFRLYPACFYKGGITGPTRSGAIHCVSAASCDRIRCCLHRCPPDTAIQTDCTPG